MKFYLIAVAAGLISGLLQGAVNLPGFGGWILVYIAPLPLFLAGLGLGLQGALVAVAVMGILSLPLAGLSYSLIQIFVYGLPIVILCRQALLSRVDNNGQKSWYPIGILLIWLNGIAVASFLIAVAGLEIFDSGIIKYVESIIQPVLEQFPLPEQREILLSYVNYLPAFFAVSWIFSMIFNGALAQGLLVRFGQNLRPSPNLAQIELPIAWIGVMVASVFLASFSDGILDVLGKTLAAISIVPYFLLGLGLVHGFVQTHKARWFLLFLLYSLMLFWPLPAIITGIGLINSVLRLQRSARSNNDGGGAEREG